MTHFLRYGTHSEKDFFLGESAITSYDAAIINANMVAYTPKAMAAFALKLKRPFFIDPQTHAFQHGFEFLVNKNGDPKQSIKNLATSYGNPISGAIESGQSVNVSDFDSVSKRKDFIDNVIKFQSDTVHNIVTTGTDSEYVNFALRDESSGLSRDNITPAGVVAPYFYIDNTDELPVSINKQFILESLSTLKEKKTPLVAQLVISKNALSDEVFRKKIIEIYTALPVETVFIWVDDFDEAEVSEESLRNFKELVVGLASKGKKVVNLYGGYFSILLTKLESGLSGVCHGMEYGESRKVVPVGGGLPRAKYYFRPLHKRLAAEDFLRIIRGNAGWREGSKNKEFASKVCDCKMCEDLEQFTETQTYEVKSKNGTRRGETSTAAAKEHSLEHYLINKKKEFDFVRDNNLSVLIEDLKKSSETYLSTAGDVNVDHLERWIKILT